MSKSEQCDERSEKWFCKLCTFANWPKSIKCTLCLTPRSAALFLDQHQQNREEKDIYKQQTTPLIVNNDKNCIPPKWMCPACTYMNWPKAIKCLQCLTARKVKISPTRSLSPSSSSIQQCKDNSFQSFNEYKNSKDSILMKNTSSTDVVTTQQQQQATSCSSTSSYNYYNDRNRAYNLDNNSYYYDKWPCSVCTYENWPKSLKCSMCLSVRKSSNVINDDKTSTTPPNANINSYTAETSSNSSNNEDNKLINGSENRPRENLCNERPRNSPSPPGAHGGW